MLSRRLTAQLAAAGAAVTAIDLGASMVAAARQRLDRSRISFAVASFEDLEAPEGSFDMIISASAFHWIDPDVKFVKSARVPRVCSARRPPTRAATARQGTRPARDG